MIILEKVREFLKANDWMDPDSIETDRKKGLLAPEPYKRIPEDGKIIDLPSPKNLDFGQMPLIKAIVKRRSHRKYVTKESISLEELSFLLYITQGLAERRKSNSSPIYGNRFRNVASGGNKHPFETYLVIFRVTGLKNGLYRYLPVEHKLLVIEKTVTKEEVIQAYNGRKFIGDAAIVFIWSTIPYRTYYSYGSTTPKIIAQDSGHLCQNLYLACTSIGLGMVAIGAYHQDRMDQLINVDGQDEFVVYVAPIGRITEKR